MRSSLVPTGGRRFPVNAEIQQWRTFVTNLSTKHVNQKTSEPYLVLPFSLLWLSRRANLLIFVSFIPLSSIKVNTTKLLNSESFMIKLIENLLCTKRVKIQDPGAGCIKHPLHHRGFLVCYIGSLSWRWLAEDREHNKGMRKYFGM